MRSLGPVTRHDEDTEVSKILIRAARRDDARAIASMAAEFYAFMNTLNPAEGELAFTEEAYVRDGFGDSPAFFGLVAELDHEPAGYMLYSFTYDVDRAVRVLHVSDLYVRAGARRRGIGTKLMHTGSEAVRQVGGHVVVWEVLTTNQAAIDFYQRLGGRFLPKSTYMFLEPAT